MSIVDKQLQKRKESMDKLFNKYPLLNKNRSEQTLFSCYNCGMELLKHAKYCTHCGREISEDIIIKLKEK